MILAVRKCCCMGGFEGDEVVKDRAGGNRRRRHAGVIGFLCRYTQGYLTCKWARICPCQKWVLLNRCFDLYKILKPLPDHKSKPRKHLFSVRAAEMVSQTVRFELPEPQRRTNPMRWIQWRTEHLLLSVGPSGFGPKRTSVLSEPVAHGPQSSLNIESSEVNRCTIGRWPCQHNRTWSSVWWLRFKSAIQLAPFTIQINEWSPTCIRVLGLIMVVSGLLSMSLLHRDFGSETWGKILKDQQRQTPVSEIAFEKRKKILIASVSL